MMSPSGPLAIWPNELLELGHLVLFSRQNAWRLVKLLPLRRSYRTRYEAENATYICQTLHVPDISGIGLHSCCSWRLSLRYKATKYLG
ncbi:hypothetical protein GUJ93_ZPchr0006g44504 [Zizania palustris]|uniref:Uncharacterized protein n=1 Tax=Zizania palustris TaxID=103762 RepID=A0A8J5SU98_ZIZPA|nr:hypothetical protein GUJ93_ZPchr0006g44504 [Zizania palustris]